MHWGCREQVWSHISFRDHMARQNEHVAATQSMGDSSSASGRQNEGKGRKIKGRVMKAMKNVMERNGMSQGMQLHGKGEYTIVRRTGGFRVDHGLTFVQANAIAEMDKMFNLECMPPFLHARESRRMVPQ